MKQSDTISLLSVVFILCILSYDKNYIYYIYIMLHIVPLVKISDVKQRCHGNKERCVQHAEGWSRFDCIVLCLGDRDSLLTVMVLYLKKTGDPAIIQLCVSHRSRRLTSDIVFEVDIWVQSKCRGVIGHLKKRENMEIK